MQYKHVHVFFTGFAGAAIVLTVVAFADSALAKDVLGALTSLAAIAAYIGAVVVGFMGLATWKRQLMGTARFEACRRVREAAGHLQSAVRTLRTAGVAAHEISEVLARDGLVRFGREDETEEEASNQWARDKVRAERLKRVREHLTRLQAEVPSAESVLGMGSLSRNMDAITGVIEEAERAFAFELEGTFPAAPGSPAHRVMVDDGTPNEFSKRISEAFGRLMALAI